MESGAGMERALGGEAFIGVAADVPAGCEACDPDGRRPDGAPCGYTSWSARAAHPEGLGAIVFTPVRDR